jgi:hypothetical protein
MARFWECEPGFLPIRSESPGPGKFLEPSADAGAAIANWERPNSSDIFFGGILFPLDTGCSRPQDREAFDRTKGLSSAGGTEGDIPIARRRIGKSGSDP